jgi:hypothetical protein
MPYIPQSKFSCFQAYKYKMRNTENLCNTSHNKEFCPLRFHLSNYFEKKRD